MATMNISLPPALKKYVRERVKAENFSNASDYIRRLIRDDQRRRIDVLERLLVEGLESGEGTVLSAAEWDKIRGQGRRRAERRHKRAK